MTVADGIDRFLSKPVMVTSVPEAYAEFDVAIVNHLEKIPPKLKTLAIRICSKILIWRESFSAK
ncbi:hypothetical protein [Taklimakanibacter lacteus]|uniref:hypothetical protein n=1 Tax=Taklimakanibacter lacteus TaxID=2268456 RepID=UPI0013C4742C